MDRLSAYAARESEAMSPEQKQKKESEAVARLLGKVSISDSSADASDKQANGDALHKLNEPAESTPEPTAVDMALAAKAKTDGQNNNIKGIPDDIKLFEIFHEQVMSLAKLQRLPLCDTIALLVSLTNLALNIYPDRLDYVDQVLVFANEKVAQYTNHADLHSQQSQSNILNLLLAPLKAYFSIFTALSLPNFIPLLHAQPYPTRRAVAGEIARTLLKNQIKIESEENLKAVLEILRVLIKEGTQQSSGYPGGPLQRKGVESEETLEEQGWLARMVHLIQNSKNETQFKLLQTAQKAFSEGHERIKHTYPPLIMSCFTLARRFKKREHLTENYSAQTSTLYKFVHSLLTALYTRVSGFNDMALRLYVSCGQIADQTEHEEIAYESFAQAFTVYEEAISDSRAQFQAVCVIASALHQTRHFGRDNYDTLITKCALHGSKLLKKPDQCRAVYLASHLWWMTPMAVLGEENGEKVRHILQGANQRESY
jgi:vacuolar protein sorting-associated protein 35